MVVHDEAFAGDPFQFLLTPSSLLPFLLQPLPPHSRVLLHLPFHAGFSKGQFLVILERALSAGDCAELQLLLMAANCLRLLGN